MASNKNAHHPDPAELRAANVKWAAAVKKADPDFFQRSKEGQYPRVLWIGCSDSRVPESVITAARPGDIFVHRNIANQVHLTDDNLLSVLEYAVDHIEPVEHVVLVGHTECGGVKACLAAAAKTNPPRHVVQPDSSPINRWLAPLVDLAVCLQPPDGGSLQPLTLVEANVRRQVENLHKTETIKKSKLAGKKVKVYGWVYEVGTGELRDLGITN